MAKTQADKDRDAVIGRNIRTLRRARRMTQAALAQFIGVSTAMVTYYESGTISLRASALEAIARELGCMVEDIVEDYR